MARKTTRPAEPFKYILPRDRKLPAAEQTVFTCRPLAQQERMQAMDNVEAVQIDGSGERQLRFRGFQQAYEIVMRCLVDVENFPAGSPVPYPSKEDREARAKYLEMMDDFDVHALGDHIFDHSTIGSAEKNFSTP
ncbi:MAG: hypothetical protein WEA80_01870 [Gemmatimonadaceae bacterium]